MIKKTATALLFAGSVIFGGFSLHAQETGEAVVEEVMVVSCEGDADGACDKACIDAAECPHGGHHSALESSAVLPDAPAVATSELARRMKQAEKAKNAAENDSWGGALTIIAMCIVLGALIILSILFSIFGNISAKLLTRRKQEAHGVTAETKEDHHDEVDSGETIAAIAMALAEYFGQGHDIEDTILTIKRMKKSYSPWNSKIYNMRQVPTHNQTRRDLR